MIGLAILAAFAAAPAQAPPPVTVPAVADGRVQCFSPDAVRKTCKSTAVFTVGADGQLTSRTTVLLEADPSVIMETVAPASVRGEALCTVLTVADVEQASVWVSGRFLDLKRVETIRTSFLASLRPLFDRELCMTPVANGRGYTAYASLEGVNLPALNQDFIWVSPDDGFQVAP